MAFNPFDVFRRNQRILFAVLTVVVMFMFVLSFGQGDFFSMVPQWLAARQKTGEVLAVVDGSKVYSSEVGDTDARRQMANQYMAAAAFRAADALRDMASQTLPRVTAANKKVIEDALQAQASGFLSPMMSMRQRFGRQAGMAPPTVDELIKDAEQTTAQTQFRLANVLTGQNTPAPDQEAAQAIVRGIELQQRQLAATGGRRREGAHYFFNQPAATNRDAVEFLLWLKKADQLGIAFTDTDVLTLANAEFYNVMKDDDWRAAEADIRGRTRYSAALLRSALADEFRVRAAQAAVLGQSYVQPNARSFDAPVDFYQFFHDQTAAATFGTVSIPAAAFVSQVTGTPEPAALRKLYQEGQLEDPAPGTARIGLREPRRLKAEWVEITGDESFYATTAAEAATALAAATKLSGFLVAPVGGVTLSTLLTAAPPAVAADPQLDQAYAGYVARQRDIIQSNWYTPFGGATSVPDTSFARTPAAAGLVATLAMPGTPLAGPALVVGAAVAADRKARLYTVPPVLFAPAMPGAANLALAIGMAAPQAAAIQPLPRAAVQSQLVADYRKSLTRSIAQRDGERLTKELTALNVKQDDPAAARKLIDEFVKVRGLKTGASKEFRDLYTIAADPGLHPIVEKIETEARRQLPTAAAVSAAIGRLFFSQMDPATQRAVPAAGFYQPQPFPPGQSVAVLAWRTAEQPGERLRAFDAPDVQAKLVAAWKRLEARKLAKKAAEELAAKCGNLGQTVVEIEPKVREAQAQLAARLPEADRGQVKYFTLDNVAPITRQLLPASDGRSPVGSFQVTPSDNIPYPTAKMTADLLAAKDKPPSTTLVLTDAPEDTAYTAVLLYRTDPDVTTFATLVFGSQASFSELAPAVQRAHQDELRKQARQNAVALLKAEFGYDKESAKLDSRGGDE